MDRFLCRGISAGSDSSTLCDSRDPLLRPAHARLFGITGTVARAPRTHRSNRMSTDRMVASLGTADLRAGAWMRSHQDRGGTELASWWPGFGAITVADDGLCAVTAVRDPHSPADRRHCGERGPPRWSKSPRFRGPCGDAPTRMVGIPTVGVSACSVGKAASGSIGRRRFLSSLCAATGSRWAGVGWGAGELSRAGLSHSQLEPRAVWDGMAGSGRGCPAAVITVGRNRSQGPSLTHSWLRPARCVAKWRSAASERR